MRKSLEDFLTGTGRFSSDQLGDARRTQRFFGGSLLSNMVRLGYLSEREAGEQLATWSGYRYIPYRELKNRKIPAEVLATVESQEAIRRQVVPFLVEEGELHIVTCQADNDILFRELERRLGFEVVPAIMPDERLSLLLERHYGAPSNNREALPPISIQDDTPAVATDAFATDAAPTETPGLPEDIGLDGLPLDTEASTSAVSDTLAGLSGGDALSSATRNGSHGAADAGQQSDRQEALGEHKPGWRPDDPDGGSLRVDPLDESMSDPEAEGHDEVRSGMQYTGGGATERPWAPHDDGNADEGHGAEPADAGGADDAEDLEEMPRTHRAGRHASPVMSHVTSRDDTVDDDGDEPAGRPRYENPFDTHPHPTEMLRALRETGEWSNAITEISGEWSTVKSDQAIQQPGAPPLEVLALAEDRHSVGRAAVELVLSMGSRRVALFSHQHERLVGWHAGGEGVSEQRFARLSLPLYTPSIFSSMRVKPNPYVGIVPEQPANREFLETLGGTAPKVAVAVPVNLKGRLVAVLYADGGPRSQDAMSLDKLLAAGAKLALALEVLLLRRKILRRLGSPPEKARSRS